MTEDHALPADDWVEQILTAHKQPYKAIGGAVENGVERPMNRALYYCDFGRYGRPFQSGEVSYLSDVNLAYKREALTATQELWRDGFHETTVNWALLSQGEKLFLDDRLVVYQCRPRLAFWKLAKERVEWGRVFANTRAMQLTFTRRMLFAAGTLLLPPTLFLRAFRDMYRQNQGIGRMLSTLPIVLIFVICWSFGELEGYAIGEAAPESKHSRFLDAKDVCK